MDPVALFVIVYLLALCCYFRTRTSGNKKARAINKYVMATMYLTFALVVFYQEYSFASTTVLLLVALVFAWLGDIFLVYDFARGGDFFLAGNICFVTYELVVLVEQGYGFGDFWWCFIIGAGLLFAFIACCQWAPKTFKLGKMRWQMTMYLSTILMHGSVGIGLMVILPGTHFALLGLGSCLFMVSDIILTLYRFVFGDKKWLVRANSLTYFVGMLLIAMSLLP